MSPSRRSLRMGTNLDLATPCKVGDKGPGPKLIQEWLTLQGHAVATDGEFGPATESAVKDFQTALNLPPSGVVTVELFQQMRVPMTLAMRPIMTTSGDTLGTMTAKYAQQHVAAKPREV